MATPPPGAKKGKKKVWWKDPTILVVGGIGAAAGLLVLLRGRGGGGAGDQAAIGTTTGESAAGLSGVPSYSSVGQDLYNAVQDSTETLREQLATLSGDVADLNLRLGKAPTTQQPIPPAGPLARPRMTLAALASRWRTTVNQLYRFNPGLRNRTKPYVYQGERLRTPGGKWVNVKV